MNIQENVTLAPYTTLSVGGAARFFVSVQTVEEVVEAITFAKAKQLPIFVLGGGSNILIADNGFEGLVIALRIPGITFEDRGETAVVTVGAGVVWDECVKWTIAHGYIGLECLSGVPGTVGGAVVANLGCYGAQTSDTFESAVVLDSADEKHEVRGIKKEECDFSYHDSMFKRASGRYLVLQASFILPTKGTSRLSYRDNRFDLESLATESGHEPTLEDVRATILKMRSEKGMLIDSYKSAGSFFHMPFVSAEQYEQITARARELDAEKEEHLRPWAWKQSDGSYKIAGGFLIEYTEYQKGYVQGSTGISPQHTLSIINHGGARAEDIARLARDMQNAVEKLFGIHLEREVEYVGDVERVK